MKGYVSFAWVKHCLGDRVTLDEWLGLTRIIIDGEVIGPLYNGMVSVVDLAGSRLSNQDLDKCENERLIP